MWLGILLFVISYRLMKIIKSNLHSELPSADVPDDWLWACLKAVEDRHQCIFDITFTVVDLIEMSELNGQYRGKYQPTNVLSFYYDTNNAVIVGEVFFCPHIIQQESISDGIALKDHYTHLIFHSLLHILGYTHQDDSNRFLMENEEVFLLKLFGIQNPYEKFIESN